MSRLAGLVVCVMALSGFAAPSHDPRAIGPWDWPTYGHDAQHTFHGRTTLTKSNVASLAPAWFFPTGLAVTATPTVVAGTVYAGSWDGDFYALDLETGALEWKFQLDAQPAVRPAPGGPPDPGSDGGMVTSSAWYEPGNASRPDLVLFGGGFTLYALDAHTGALYWKQQYTGRPELPTDPVNDGARIFSSPVVADGKVMIGVAVDGDRDHRGYIVAADLATGVPVWIRETDVDATGAIRNDGCGTVWSSGTLLPRAGLVVFDVADCHFSNPGPYDETVLALRVRDGAVAWTFRPDRADPRCDFDFGATVNAGINAGGVAKFVGVAGKDGTYYSLDPRNGNLRWSTNVVFGGQSGGFIGTTAYDGERLYGATALGDTPRTEVCDPSDPRDTALQEPTVHAFDATTGAVSYEDTGGASFAPTTAAGPMTFNCPALAAALDVRDAATGQLLATPSLPAPCWSGIATVGNALVFGTGASFSTSGTGVMVLTPGGVTPSVP